MNTYTCGNCKAGKIEINGVESYCPKCGGSGMFEDRRLKTIGERRTPKSDRRKAKVPDRRKNNI
jgi:hypothetical protein